LRATGNGRVPKKSFRHAIALDPNRSESHRDFAKFFFTPLGRAAEAIEQLRLAENADPLAPDVHNLLSSKLVSAGKYEEATQHCNKLPADYWGKTECLGNVRLQQGEPMTPSGSSKQLSFGACGRVMNFVAFLALPMLGRAAATMRKDLRRRARSTHSTRLGSMQLWETRTGRSKPWIELQRLGLSE
jgi:tetratricopeptide (TPR) repeat protein